jgi:hypothetical protein
MCDTWSCIFLDFTLLLSHSWPLSSCTRNLKCKRSKLLAITQPTNVSRHGTRAYFTWYPVFLSSALCSFMQHTVFQIACVSRKICETFEVSWCESIQYVRGFSWTKFYLKLRCLWKRYSINTQCNYPVTSWKTNEPGVGFQEGRTLNSSVVLLALWRPNSAHSFPYKKYHILSPLLSTWTLDPWRWDWWAVPKRRHLINLRCVISQKTEEFR